MRRKRKPQPVWTYTDAPNGRVLLTVTHSDGAEVRWLLRRGRDAG